MQKLLSLGTLLIVILLTILPLSAGQREDILGSMPRVDVHTHIAGDFQLMDAYVDLAKVLKEEYDVNQEIWIDLGVYTKQEKLTASLLEEVDEKYHGRFLICLSDYRIANGLKYSPEELAEWQERGVVGYKIWVGLSPLVDDPANDSTFTKMEQIGLLGASVHIAQPYPSKYCQDPVQYWRAHNAWERVLDRHPRLTVVQAHMLDHFQSDEQLEYLGYVLETYPNVNLDLSARMQRFHHMDRDKLREFVIKYDDRILFGTDSQREPLKENLERTASRYSRCFQILETNNVVKGGFYGDMEVRGLELPIDTLEKIYYRNAARLYPRVKQVLENMGYTVK